MDIVQKLVQGVKEGWIVDIQITFRTSCSIVFCHVVITCTNCKCYSVVTFSHFATFTLYMHLYSLK